VFVVWLLVATLLILLLAPRVWNRDSRNIPPPPKETFRYGSWLKSPRVWTALLRGYRPMEKEHRKFRRWYLKHTSGRIKPTTSLRTQDVHQLWKHLRTFWSRQHHLTKRKFSLPLTFATFENIALREKKLSTTGFLWFFRRFLEAFHLPNREVVTSSRHLWGSPRRLQFVEFWLASKKKWIAIHLHSGLLMQRKGRWLSAQEASILLKQKKQIEWKPPNPGAFKSKPRLQQLFASLMEVGEIRWFPTSGRAAGTMRILGRWPSALDSLVASGSQRFPLPSVQMPKKARLLNEWKFPEWADNGWYHFFTGARPTFAPLRKHLGPAVAKWLHKRRKSSIFVTTWAGMRLQGPMMELEPGEYIFALKARVWRGRLQVTLRKNGRLLALRGFGQAHQFQGRSLQWLRWRVRLPQGGRVQWGLKPVFAAGLAPRYGFWELEKAQLWKAPTPLKAPFANKLLVHLPESRQLRVRGLQRFLQTQWKQKNLRLKGIPLNKGKLQKLWFEKPQAQLRLSSASPSSTLLLNVRLYRQKRNVAFVSVGNTTLTLNPQNELCLQDDCLVLNNSFVQSQWMMFGLHGKVLTFTSRTQQHQWVLSSTARRWRLGSQGRWTSFQGKVKRLLLYKGTMTTRGWRWLTLGEHAKKQRPFHGFSTRSRLKPSQWSSLRHLHTKLTLDDDKSLKYPTMTFHNVRKSAGYQFSGLRFGHDSYLSFRGLDFQQDQTLLFWFRPLSSKAKLLTLKSVSPASQPSSRPTSTSFVVSYVSKDFCFGKRCTKGNTGWSMIALVWKSEKQELSYYLRGKLIGRSKLAVRPSRWWFGGEQKQQSSAQFSIDQLLLFQRALGTQDIALYNKPTTSPLSVLRRYLWDTHRPSLLFAQDFSTLKTNYADIAAKGVRLEKGRQGKALYVKKGGVWAWKQTLSAQIMTLSFWVKPKVLKGTLLTFQKPPSDTDWHWKLLLSRGKPCFVLSGDKGYKLCSPKPLRRHHWAQITLSLDGRSGRTSLWVQGRKVAENKARFFRSLGVLTVGGPNKSNGFVGWIDELRLWDRVFSAKTLQTLNFLPMRGQSLKKKGVRRTILDCNKSSKTLLKQHKGWTVRGLSLWHGRKGGGCHFAGKKAGVQTTLGIGVSRELSLWFKAASGQSGGLAEMRVPSKGYWSWQWNLQTDRRLCFVYYAGKSTKRCSQPLPVDTWIKSTLRLDWKNRRASLWVNGKRAGRLKLVTPLSGARLLLGQSSGSGVFHGILDEVKKKELKELR
jgi:hypothetical protein